MDLRPCAVAAVDLGASSGRVFLATASEAGLALEEVWRFANGGVDHEGVFSWDLPALRDQIDLGLATASRWARERGLRLNSLGIDSWAVDYGLLDERGEVMGWPRHYRDEANRRSFETVSAHLTPRQLFERSGIAPLVFNTVYQLAGEGDRLSHASAALLIPDLLNYLLTGVRAWEITNCSTTSLLDRERAWDDDLFERVGIPRHLVGNLVLPGHHVGPVTSPTTLAAGVESSVEVIAVASHDTASAVAAVPATSRNFAYISSGTWSLVGVELDAPLVSDAAFRAGFTNELGVEGRTRFLRNVMGFWMLQEVLREYAAEGASLDAAQVTREARAVTPRLFLVDAQSDVFLAPGDMRGRLAAECTRRGGPAPSTPAEFARCILDSLALSYRRVVEELVDVTGTRIDDVRIVGGGALNELLCQLTADATGRTVFAGPVEAAALGNAVVQWRSLGVLEGTLDDVRALIGRSFTVQTYEPDVTQSLEWVRVAASMP